MRLMLINLSGFVGSVLAGLCLSLIGAAITLIFMACGPQASPPKILPPNTEQACRRAVNCSAFMVEQLSACIACLEHIDPRADEQIKEYLKDNPIESLPCDRVVLFAHQTNLSS